MQTRRHSFYESASNTLFGMLLALVGQYLIFGTLGYDVSHRDQLIIMVFFTSLSVARQYVLRRIFNRLAVSNRAHCWQRHIFGYRCSLPPYHDGPHEAHQTNGRVVARWYGIPEP